MIITLKDQILATDRAVWQPKVERILLFYWDEKDMEDISRRFQLLWEEIRATPARYGHNVIVDFLIYECMVGERKQIKKGFSIFDEDQLMEDFPEIPDFDQIRLDPWEEGNGHFFADIPDLEVIRLLLKGQAVRPESRNMGELSKFLGARLPAYNQHRQERMIVSFLAMLLDEYSGRVAMLPEPFEDRPFERKWGYLYGRISEYKAAKQLRQEIMWNDI